MSATKNWRTRPFARFIVYSSCSFMLFTSSAPLHAALPVPANQIPVGGVVTHGSALINPNVSAGRMIIDQSSAKAILEWQSFNIGKDAVVQFNQPSSSSVALNKINDGSPTAIFGALNANGSVYLINHNGIVFGQGAQVNVHGLLASTLNISDELFQSTILQSAINNGEAALNVDPNATAPMGSITVESGATIKAHSGGQVLMFAPEIINRGDISTPDGQTVLAASKDKVYVVSSDRDEDLRGILVEVDTGGSVTNVGNIVAERGNVTLLGLAVNQEGRVRATSTVDVNGSIRLLARDKAGVFDSAAGFTPDQKEVLLIDEGDSFGYNSRVAIASRFGKVKLGSNSITEVVVEDSKATATDAQTQLQGRVDVSANTVELQAGSKVIAKGGRVNVVTNPGEAEQRIQVGAGSLIDVSGENVVLPISRRVVEVELRGTELQDSPLQRNGVLRGKKVLVDIDKGSPLISDLAPTLARIPKTAQERSTAGGTVNLKSAAGGVVFNDGATIDISGGSVTYESGLINTTKLISKGRIFDIGSADPNRTYDGILGKFTAIHPKWGKSVYGNDSIFNRGTWREGFVEGHAAGKLNVTAGAGLYGIDLLDLNAAAQRGTLQRNSNTAPVGGSLAITLLATTQENIQQALFTQIGSSTNLDVEDSLQDANGDSRVAIFSAEKLNSSGLGRLELHTNGAVNIDSTVNLVLAPKSSVQIDTTSSAGINVDGRIRATGGEISLLTKPYGSSAQDVGNLPIYLGAAGLLDVSGDWVNELLDPVANRVRVVDGGKISMQANGDLILAQGSVLRADAGAWLGSNGVLHGGSGGDIALVTKREHYDAGSTLNLLGSMSAYGFDTGGTLAITGNAFQIGSGPLLDEKAIQLSPVFFAEGGFSDYSLTANLLGVEIKSGAQVSLRQKNLQITDIRKAAETSSGADLAKMSSIVDLPTHERKAVNLSIEQGLRVYTNALKSEFRMEQGASITADPGGKIEFVADQSLYIDGILNAPGGQIRLEVKNQELNKAYSDSQALWLGSHARLSAAAARVAVPSNGGLDQGRVWDAGEITLTASRGAIVAEPGSILDVSGASFRQDSATRLSTARSGVRTDTVNAAAGSLSFKAAEGIAVYSTLLGAGVGDGLGGSISYLLDGNSRSEDRVAIPGTSDFPMTALDTQISQSLPEWAGLQFGDEIPALYARKALIAVDQVHAGGFTRLQAGSANQIDNTSQAGDPAVVADFGRVSFADDLELSLADSLILNASSLSLNNHNVKLSAGTVQLGSTSNNSLLQIVNPSSAGVGTLDINAGFIEVLGNLSISGASTSTLASRGDIRLRAHTVGGGRNLMPAELSVAGNLTMKADQIYPSTLSDYTIRLNDTGSVFTTLAGDSRSPILSAGGKLKIIAPTIEHFGVLAAPLGELLLGESGTTASVHLASGSVLDVSANGQLIPFGRLRGDDISWTYPISSGLPLEVTKTPEKRIEIAGQSVNAEAGSQINLSGGGDIYAFEFVPGPGGSKDFLDVANAKGAFAVIPLLNSPIAPYDSVEMQGQSITSGTIIYLEGGGGLAAGEYAVLPAHYALLPGAYLITPSSKTLLPGESASGIDGTSIVSGRFGRAFAGQYGSQWQGFYVEAGTAARLRSEYNESTGDKLFADRGVNLAADAGRLVLAPEQSLTLASTINAAAQNGQRAQVDIVANQIEVVQELDQGGSAAVQLLASTISNLELDSLLLGGRRSRDGDATVIDVVSDSVTIREGAHLAVPDLILAAKSRVAVETGASVFGVAGSTQKSEQIRVSGDGAILRASSAGQVDVDRSNVTGTSGVLEIAAGASVGAKESVLLDSTSDLRLDGALLLQDAALNLTANRISLGDNVGAVDGVVFDNNELAALGARDLRLSSRSSIDFYGNTLFEMARAELNAGSLRSMTAGDVRVAAADTLQIRNGANVAPEAASGTGGGKLALIAERLILGGDSKTTTAAAIVGFDSVQLGEAGKTTAVQGSGKFTLSVPGALSIVADRISGNADAKNLNDLQIIAGGAVTTSRAGAATAAASIPESGLGTMFSLTGQRIENNTLIDLPSGRLTLASNGLSVDPNNKDSVVLGAQSVLDVSGRRSVAGNGVAADTNGGVVTLSSRSGDITAAAGSVVKLGSVGGDAGRLNLSAPMGQVNWQGSIDAATNFGAHGGSLSIDAGVIANINDWIDRAVNARIDRLLSLRSRTGDLAVERDIRAEAVDVQADSGSVTLASRIDASGEAGGQVSVYAGGNLDVTSGAVIDASATASDGRGGKVALGSRSGTLRLGSGALIDVAGGADARKGRVDLRAARNASNDDVALENAGVQIAGAERIQLAAFNPISYTGLDSTQLDQARSDASVFMSHEVDIKTRLGALGSQGAFHLVPEVEVFSADDLDVSTAVNFAADADADGVLDWRFGAANEAGILTLRAVGNVNVEQSLLDGIVVLNSPIRAFAGGNPRVLLGSDAWSYRIAAGADASAASPGAVVAGVGDIVVSNGADILTGSGDISLAAGNNIRVEQADSVISSLGKAKITEYQVNPLPQVSFPEVEQLIDTGTLHPYLLARISREYLMYPEAGGDVSLNASGNVDFAPTQSFFSDWISRFGGVYNKSTAQGIPAFATTTWGVMLDYLEQGVAALGGGNMKVSAGGDIANLNAALPVTGKQQGQVGAGGELLTNVVETIGGGNLDVEAGGNIMSPRILVDRGVARLSAGGDIDRADGGLGAVVVLADSIVNLFARGSVDVDTVFNSTVMPQSAKQHPSGTFADESYFFTYTDSSALSVNSTAGDVNLAGDVEAFLAAFSARFVNRPDKGAFGSATNFASEKIVLTTYPGSVSLQASGGDINLGASAVVLFPNSSGDLSIFADGNLGLLGDSARLVMSDAPISALPTVTVPVKTLDMGTAFTNDVIGLLLGEFRSLAAPVHSGDKKPISIVAANGDIGTDEGVFRFDLSKQARIYAGNDISNVDFALQNILSSDVSEIRVGRDIRYAFTIDEATGALLPAARTISIAGPGRLDVIAGRDIDLGASFGVQSTGDQSNSLLPDDGADITLMAGINGPSAFTDPVLYNAFSHRYFDESTTLKTSFIDWFGAGNFKGDIRGLVGAFTGKQYSDSASALTDFAQLPILTRQAISLEAFGATEELAKNYAAELVDFVSFDRFSGDLMSAVSAVTGVAYSDNSAAAVALAQLSASQQQKVAVATVNVASAVSRRELILSVLNAEMRKGGIENAKGITSIDAPYGFERSTDAIALVFPGDKWQGDISLVFSAIRTLDDGDVNLLAPGGGIDVGTAGFTGLTKDPGQLGIVAQRYGAINAVARNDISVNQSRIFSLDGGPLSLWSTSGDIDAGRGAKTALSVPPPVAVVKEDGSIQLEFPPAVSGSGIQAARNSRKRIDDRGQLNLVDSETIASGETRTGRQRFYRSLRAGDVFLFAPEGVIDAGDAGIAVEGNLLLAAQQVIGADNISVGGISIGVPTTTSISAGTLSLGDTASSATESATNSMNDAIRDAAAALAESTTAFVTVDVIGLGD